MPEEREFFKVRFRMEMIGNNMVHNMYVFIATLAF